MRLPGLLLTVVTLCRWGVAGAGDQHYRMIHAHRHNHGYSHRHRTKEAKKHMPIFHLLRRQVVNYHLDWRATLTVVYQAEHNFTVRWFRHSETETLSNSEIPNMLIVEENSEEYRVDHLKVGDVKGTILTIFRVSKLPSTFCVVFTAQDVPLQYHVYTQVKDAVTLRREHLDSVHWETRPRPSVSFGYRAVLGLSCSAVLDSESALFTDELSMYRLRMQRPGALERAGGPRLDTVSCGKVHRDSAGITEEAGKYLYLGRRTKLPLRYLRYNMTFRVTNATRDDQGMYVCLLERQWDKTFVSSWVRQNNLAAKPQIEVLPCEASVYDRRQGIIYFTQAQETCFRCRGYGYPPPKITAYKDMWPLTNSAWMHVDSHVNVGDGGIHETTFTLWKPNRHDEGQYSCTVTNGLGEATVSFKGVVLNTQR